MKRRKFNTNILTTLGALGISNLSFGNEFLKKNSKKLGIALVGLGNYSTRRLAPALLETSMCELRAVVTGTPSKIPKWKKKYGLKDYQVYNYKNFDSIVNNSEIDIVYVVLPNNMHKEFTIRAFKANKHVICEKPLALNAREAEEMIAASKKANKQLYVGYRLHYEPHHLETVRLCRDEAFGKIKHFEGGFGFRVGNPNTWRLKKQYGGGALMDVGIYVIQGARYTIGEEPISVTAREYKSDKIKFKEVDELIIWQMEFPSGAIANCTTSFAASTNHLFVAAEKGFIRISPSYTYGKISGYTSKYAFDFEQVNQQALHMDGISNHILNGVPHINTGGDEGLKDMRIIDAIFKSTASGGRKVVI